MADKMKVLVTGAAGLVGGHLREFSQSLSLRVLGETESSIRGKKSRNREFFMFFEKTLQTPAHSFPADTINIETQND